MSDHLKQTVLIGAGPMAEAYAKVLQDLGKPFAVIGRGESSAAAFTEKTGTEVLRGGLENNISIVGPESNAIIAVGAERLYDVGLQVMKAGCKQVLIEKPAGLNLKEIEELSDRAKGLNVQLFVAYNRRYYASVAKAREIIKADGGLQSFHFEFTEWSHRIADLKKADGIKAAWLLANSTHVIDLGFQIGGHPVEMQCFQGGQLDWHPPGSIFVGAGRTEAGALFSYNANWTSAGRWGVEFLTRHRRLYLQPMEELHEQRTGTITREAIELDNSLDLEFKPGVHRQLQAFLHGKDAQHLCTIAEHATLARVYAKIENSQ